MRHPRASQPAYIVGHMDTWRLLVVIRVGFGGISESSKELASSLRLPTSLSAAGYHSR